MIQSLAFYCFAAVLVTSAFMVVSSRNPVHSVLFLILGFFNAAGLFVLLGAEFIAMLLVIVYVGAVAVLFLFVVMMLDINFAELRKGAMQYVPVGLLIGGVLLLELITMYTTWWFSPSVADNRAAVTDPAITSNTVALGQVLYTQYIYAFQIAGLILFVAMIGSIVLTHRTRPGVRRQSIASQNARRPQDVIELKKVQTGAGVQ